MQSGPKRPHDKLIPYGKQNITAEDIQCVVDALNSPFITQGPLVGEFESLLAKRVKAKHAIAVNSATSALHIACLALKLGPGDTVWTTPITFVASANCALYCGASVDFVDVEPTTGLMSVNALSQKLEAASKNNSLPKIIIPVHLCGTSCNMVEISNLARKYGIDLIEDASHAIGGNYQEQPVGNCQHSSITVFSFHPVKIITSGEGGVATTNNTELAKAMQDLRSHGITKEARRFKQEPDGPWTYEQQTLGYNYRMTDIHAALGLSQLKRLDHIVKNRNKLRDHYTKLLSDLPVELLEIPNDCYSALHLAVIRLNNKSPELHKKLFEDLRANLIGVQLHYSPVHLQPYYRKLGFKDGNFPEAEAYAKNAISLPMYIGLSQEEQKYIAELLEYLLK